MRGRLPRGSKQPNEVFVAPITDPKVIPWSTLHRTWSLYVDELCPALLTHVAQFIEIEQPKRPPYGYIADYDFWPLHLVDERRRSIRDWSATPEEWRGQKGTQDTAALLWEHRNDPERMALVLLSAWTHDKRHLPGKDFRDIDYSLVMAARELDMLEQTRWHHASRNALPVKGSELDVLRYGTKESPPPVLETHDLVRIAAESAALSLTTMAVVRITNTPDHS